MRIFRDVDMIMMVSEEIAKMINNGWRLVPHTYSSGQYHEWMFNPNNGNIALVKAEYKYPKITDAAPYYNYYEVSVTYYDYDFSKMKSKFRDVSWIVRDCGANTNTIVIKTAYNIGRNAYTDDLDYVNNAYETKKNRFAIRDKHNIKEFDLDKCVDIILPAIRRKPKCKTVKASDVTEIVKSNYCGNVEYRARVKGNLIVIK